MDICANSFVWYTRLAVDQIPNSTEPHAEQLETGIPLLNWLKQIADNIGDIESVGKLLFICGTVLVGFVLYLFITKRKVLRKLNNHTKQVLKEKLTAYTLDTQSQDESKTTLISSLILPVIKHGTNQSVDPTDDVALCSFAMDRKIKYLIGDGGLGKTSLLLYIADKFYRKKIKMRQKTIRGGSSNVLVQLVTSDQLNEMQPSNTQNNNCLLNILQERSISMRNHKSVSNQEIIEKPKLIQALVGILQKKHKELIAPDDTWASFEKKRKKRKRKNKSEYDFRLLLLIDGYNELDDSVRDILIRELDCIDRETQGSISVIVTSRYKPGKWPESVYNLKELSMEQIDKYIDHTVASAASDIEDQFKISPEMKVLLTKPILLTMYCQTCKLTQDSPHSNVPFHKIDSMSDIYWNYLCSQLVRTVQKVEHGQESRDMLTSKVVILFFVLPCVAMEREANDNGLNFSMMDFKEAVDHILKNRDVLFGNYDRQLSTIINDEYLQNLTGLEAAFAQNISACELPMIRCADQPSGNRKYAFTHEFHRNFFAAVYRVQRDIATLYDADDKYNRYIPYIYSNCEKLPDISLVIRKFYYELAAYYLRHVLKQNDRDELATKSVRYNSLLSDIYYYGDAFNNAYGEALKYEANMEKSLNCAENAISIGMSRLEKIDSNNPEEMNRKTDMTILCWARWNATHIIQFDMKGFCSDQEKLKKYREKAYQYSKDNARATGYGEFIGFDKLAQMLHEKGFLPDHIIDKELEAVPEKDDNGVTRTRETRISLLCEKYLQHGKSNGYHFSFNKHAIWLERDLMNMKDSDSEGFAKQLNQVYALLEQSYQCKQNDYYALSRILFYGICYQDKLTTPVKESIPELIANADSSMSKQLSFHGTSEIYGYDNFCENAGFWFLMKMFSKNSTPDLTNVMELIEKITKNQEFSCEFDQDAAIQAADYYRKLFNSTHKKLGNTFDDVDKKNSGTVKTRLKSAIAYRFVQYIYDFCGSNKGTFLIEDLCNQQDFDEINRQFKKYLNGTENKFFMEDRYTTIYNCCWDKAIGGAVNVC